MTETGGPAWRQTIFWPFLHFSRLGRGHVLRTHIDCPTYAARYNDPNGPIDEYFSLPAVPYLKLAAVHDGKAGLLTLFALNRSLDETLPLSLQAGGFAKLTVRQAMQLCDPDLAAVNSKADPDRVRPSALSAVTVHPTRPGLISWGAASHRRRHVAIATFCVRLCDRIAGDTTRIARVSSPNFLGRTDERP
jgi:alpha-N-arabinofuranosidase